MNEKMNAGIGRFRQKVLAFMRKNHMTDRGDRALAAVSGGADSVCLLLLLCELAAELGIHVFAFHMNHGIRGAEADRDERFVEKLCGRMGVPLTVVHGESRIICRGSPGCRRRKPGGSCATAI